MTKQLQNWRHYLRGAGAGLTVPPMAAPNSGFSNLRLRPEARILSFFPLGVSDAELFAEASSALLVPAYNVVFVSWGGRGLAVVAKGNGCNEQTRRASTPTARIKAQNSWLPTS